LPATGTIRCKPRITYFKHFSTHLPRRFRIVWTDVKLGKFAGAAETK
jgi:hypothetical protein